MSTVIKATDRNRGIQRVPFNFNDMADQADQYLAKVHAEAARILAGVKKEAETIRRGAEAEGRAAGQRMIEEMVAKQVAQQMATLLPALRETVQQIRHARQAWLTHWEKCAVATACAIASRLIRKELSATPEITLTLIREALELAAGSDEIRLHLNPADHEALGEQIETLRGELSALAAAEIIAEPSVTPGGCRVETRMGVIDQQFEAQLARIEEELT